MKRRIYRVIERANHTEENIPSSYEHKDGYEELPYNKNAKAVMESESFKAYVAKHGYHFTDKLADHASKLMVNADGSSHSWTTTQVKKAMEQLNMSVHKNVTSGDVAYTANMAYADFYPELLKDEVSCIKYAHILASDVDGYEGMIFARWLMDIIGKNVQIDWQKCM